MGLSPSSVLILSITAATRARFVMTIRLGGLSSPSRAAASEKENSSSVKCSEIVIAILVLVAVESYDQNGRAAIAHVPEQLLLASSLNRFQCAERRSITNTSPRGQASAPELLLHPAQFAEPALTDEL